MREQRAKDIEKTISEIRQRRKNYENKSGKLNKIAYNKYQEIIVETCKKYNQKESTIRMVLNDPERKYPIPIQATDLKGNKEIFESVKEATEKTKVPGCIISDIVNGRKESHKGFKFERL